MGEDIEAQVLGDRIYVLTDPGVNKFEMYRVKNYSKNMQEKLRGPQGKVIKFLRYSHQVEIRNPARSRGLFIRTCGKLDLTNKVLFKFYSYRAGLIPPYSHQ